MEPADAWRRCVSPKGATQTWLFFVACKRESDESRLSVETLRLALRRRQSEGAGAPPAIRKFEYRNLCTALILTCHFVIYIYIYIYLYTYSLIIHALMRTVGWAGVVTHMRTAQTSENMYAKHEHNTDTRTNTNTFKNFDVADLC